MQQRTLPLVSHERHPNCTSTHTCIRTRTHTQLHTHSYTTPLLRKTDWSLNEFGQQSESSRGCFFSFSFSLLHVVVDTICVLFADPVTLKSSAFHLDRDLDRHCTAQKPHVGLVLTPTSIYCLQVKQWADGVQSACVQIVSLTPNSNQKHISKSSIIQKS